MASREKQVLSAAVTSLLLLVATAIGGASGCGRRNAAGAIAKPASDAGLELAKCGGVGQIARPLIIEWDAADRASLESQLRRKMLAVRFQGCRVEVLRGCNVPGSYSYHGTTHKSEAIRIRNEDELYASLPLSAIEFESKLATAGELSVAMDVVGSYEATKMDINRQELTGRCENATHVIVGAQVGAFEFHTGASAEIGAGVEVAKIGEAGGRSESEREVLRRDGDPRACMAATSKDAGPPEGCGGPLKLELLSLGELVCPGGSAWNGQRCACPAGLGWNGQTQSCGCPAGTVAQRSGSGNVCVASAPAARPVQPATTTRPATPQPAARPASVPSSTPSVRPSAASAQDPLCSDLCERSLQCEAELSGMTMPPSGNYETGLLATCMGPCSVFMANDRMRAAAQTCMQQTTCEGFLMCLDGGEDPGMEDFEGFEFGDAELDDGW